MTLSKTQLNLIRKLLNEDKHFNRGNGNEHEGLTGEEHRTLQLIWKKEKYHHNDISVLNKLYRTHKNKL